MGKGKKSGFQLAWIGYLLVFIGCMIGWMTFGHAGAIMRNNLLWGLISYAVIISSLIGVIIGVLMMLNARTKIPAFTNLLILILCVGGGVMLWLMRGNNVFGHLSGILVLVGWIVAVIGTFFRR